MSEHSDERADEVMIRRRFLTPKVRQGHLATGEQVLAYVERVNLFALLVVCVLGLVCAVVFGGAAQVYGVLCGGGIGLVLFLISFFASRYRGSTRLVSAAVQGGGYVAKFAVIVAFFLILSRLARNVIDVRVAAGVVIILLVARLVLSSVIITRTPVALDVNHDDEQ